MVNSDGLMYVREWNNLQYASAAAFLLAVYSDYLSAANAKLNCPDGSVQPQELLDFSKSQVIKQIFQETKTISLLSLNPLTDFFFFLAG